MSDAHEKWYRYLPAENMRSLHSYHSREEQHPDNYRLSLERRLETLFREEKDILKERHYANSISRSAQNKEQRSQTHSNVRLWEHADCNRSEEFKLEYLRTNGKENPAIGTDHLTQ
jgi:hypothetical protein